jgi:hypothetical protein
MFVQRCPATKKIASEKSSHWAVSAEHLANDPIVLTARDFEE